MAKGKITKSAVDKLRAQAAGSGAAQWLWDTDTAGFGVRASANGAASYVLQYWQGGRGGRSRRMTLGKHGKITCDKARTMAQEALGKVASGSDPAQEKFEKRLKLSAETVNQAIALYLKTQGKKNKSWSETRRLLEYDAVPLLGSKPIAIVERKHVAAAIDDIASRSPSVARAVFAALRPFFRWATERGLIETNPMRDLKAPAPMKARDRVLSDAELKAFWVATEKLGHPFTAIFRLLLLTGQRREEVAGMRWSELDLDSSEWAIDKERAKNGKAHVVDLCPEAV